MGFTQNEYTGKEILVPSSILGYRQWYWINKELKSSYSTIWDKESLTSVCKRYSGPEGSVPEHPSPSPGCTCGIYAHYLPLESYERVNNVFGVMEASGKLLMGTKGLRAEKARIVALAGYGSSNRWFQTKEKTRGIYPEDLVDFCTQIGVPYFPTVKQMVYEFPQVDLTSLGVPSLDKWKASRERDKTSQEQRLKAMMDKHKSLKAMEEAMFDAYKILPSNAPYSAANLMRETMKHLGGY